MPDIPLPEDLSTYIRSMESRIRALETAPRLQNSSVVDGVTTVNDATGVVKTQFGLLSDGTYGLAVRNPTGSLVNVNNTLFPVIGSYAPTQNVTATSWTLLPSGPSVNATIGESGRALVTATCDLGLLNSNSTARLGFRIGGTNYRSGFVSVSDPAALILIASSIGRPVLVTGLTPGVTTFACVAEMSSGTGQFSNTTIVVQPF
jgi:hypothetical protein